MRLIVLPQVPFQVNDLVVKQEPQTAPPIFITSPDNPLMQQQQPGLNYYLNVNDVPTSSSPKSASSPILSPQFNVQQQQQPQFNFTTDFMTDNNNAYPYNVSQSSSFPNSFQ